MTQPLVQITDAATGSQATIMPEFGFNCVSFRPGGREQDEVLWSLPEFTLGQQRPSRSGTPILFPYPGRLHGKQLNYAARTYALDGDDGRGNAIHGYVLGRPWRVIEQSGSRLVGRFAVPPNDPEWSKRWPAAFELTVAYEVRGRALRCTIDVKNPDDKQLPFGLGLHPWFRLPATPNSPADDARVTVPASQRYEQSNMLPTGRLLPAKGSFDLQHGPRFGDLKLDDVYTGLTSAGLVRTSLESADQSRRVDITFSDNFSHCVVFTPANREAICVEPYTCAPDAYELLAEGVNAGLRTLAAGESARYWMRIEA